MHIHCEGIYNLIWQGHTLIVGRTTDKAKQWHQLGVCISKIGKSSDYEFFFQKPTELATYYCIPAGSDSVLKSKDLKAILKCWIGKTLNEKI